MSKGIRAAPTWHGGCFSARTYLFGRLALILNVNIGQLFANQCDKLKYVQVNAFCYKQMKRPMGKSFKSVQTIVGGY
jgi:hypothetical protein